MLKDGSVKIGNFTSCCLTDGGICDEYRGGTLLYSAPEILKRNRITNKADIWSIGCIIHEICTLGWTWGESTNLAQIQENILHADPKKLPREYSEFLTHAVNRMLAKKPEDRPSAKDLLNTLHLKDFQQFLLKNMISFNPEGE